MTVSHFDENGVELACLHCEQTGTEIRERNTICGIEGGYEYVELVEEWARHRWAPWSDRELTRQGIRPEAFDKYRRFPVTQFEYVPCADTVRGHFYSPFEPESEWDLDPRYCCACGHDRTEPVVPPVVAA